MRKQLGKKAAKQDSRTLRLADYLSSGRIDISPKSYVDYQKRLKKNGGFPLFANDRLGDCVLASRAHGLQVITSNESGSPIPILDAEVIADYREVGGYQGTPATDNGAYMLDSLNQWRKKGMRANGKRHKILAYAKVDVTDSDELKLAVQLFGGIYAGLSLPLYARDKEGDWTWYSSRGVEGNAAPGSWGGHAVWMGRASDVKKGIITWGAEKIMNQGFVNKYCDEAYVVLMPEWAEDGKAPSGFDLDRLLEDLKARTS